MKRHVMFCTKVEVDAAGRERRTGFWAEPLEVQVDEDTGGFTVLRPLLFEFPQVTTAPGFDESTARKLETP